MLLPYGSARFPFHRILKRSIVAQTPNQKAFVQYMHTAHPEYAFGPSTKSDAPLWKPTATDLKLVDAMGPATAAAILLAREKSAATGKPITLDIMRNPHFVRSILGERGIDLGLIDPNKPKSAPNNWDAKKELDSIQKINSRFDLGILKDKFNQPTLDGKTTVDAFYKAVEGHVDSPEHKPYGRVKPARPTGM